MGCPWCECSKGSVKTCTCGHRVGDHDGMGCPWCECSKGSRTREYRGAASDLDCVREMGETIARMLARPERREAS
jgi:hypothetical protein